MKFQLISFLSIALLAISLGQPVSAMKKELDIVGAILFDEKDEVRKLLSENREIIDKSYYKGKSLLHYAAGMNEKLVEIVLQYGADLNYKDNDGWTALHDACAGRDKEIVKALLTRGAFINCINNDGMTPEAVARRNGRFINAQLIIAERNRREIEEKNIEEKNKERLMRLWEEWKNSNQDSIINFSANFRDKIK